jgi:hypothetical protein
VDIASIDNRTPELLASTQKNVTVLLNAYKESDQIKKEAGVATEIENSKKSLFSLFFFSIHQNLQFRFPKQRVLLLVISRSACGYFTEISAAFSEIN